MKKYVLFMIVLSLAAAVFLPAEGPAVTGYARSHAGVFLDGFEYSVFQNTLSLNLEYGQDTAAFRANPYLYQYTDGALEFGLRELYLDLYLENLDLRLGKQQIIWGRAEGAFITDVVSPKDMRQFVLPDFTEIRLGITALRADWYLGSSTIELVLVPAFVPSVYPGPGSAWAAVPSFPVAPEMLPARQVPLKPENGEIFGKFSYLGSSFDFELMGGYMWDDDPSLVVTRTVDPGTGMLLGLSVQPEYRRLALAGGSAAASLGPVVLRGEGAYYFGKHFMTSDPADSDGLSEKDYIHYLAGADLPVLGADMSVQFIQRIILGYETPLVQDEFQTMLTYRAAARFFREKLFVEFFSYIGFDAPDALLRPKLTYKISDGFDLAIGADIFLGDSGTFGQFDGNDQVYLKATLSF